MRHLALIVTLACAVITPFVAARVARAADKPNVLFIAVDDLRPELNCYGATQIHSPNIDRLAARGTLFLRAYCQQAVCSPSRTSLLTGLRPDTTKVYDLVTHFRKTIPDAVTLPQHFKDEGYDVVGMGKIFHSGLNDPKSWSEPWTGPKRPQWVLPENQKIVDERVAEAKSKGLKGKTYSRASRAAPYEMADVPDDAYHDGALAEDAIAAMKRLTGQDKPWFLAVGFLRPHLPFNSPKKYWDLYDPAKITLADNPFAPKGAPDFALHNSGEIRVYAGVPNKGALDDDLARTLRHGYYASVSYTDANVGKLLDALDKSGVADNTIIVLWGDHGWQLGEHGLWCKHTNFETSAWAPLIMVTPKQAKRGTKTNALVEFVDIYPTLCEVAGLPIPTELQGTSFKPLLDAPDTKWKPAAFSQYPRGKLMGYSMRTDRYRYTVWVDQKDHKQVAGVELYDHLKDAEENVNVADDPEYKTTRDELQKQWDAGWEGAKPIANQ
ncbi:MAG: sulfatase-like hydrolase/transferase [Phycisphaera sp.]|nr:sulfatase-like hydrolase/transferase [Phycisphaera sp.]